MASSCILIWTPYDIKDNLYGKKGSMHKFDHDKFAEDCENDLDCLKIRLI